MNLTAVRSSIATAFVFGLGLTPLASNASRPVDGLRTNFAVAGDVHGADNFFILLLTSTGWDQEKFQIPAGTYNIIIDDAAGNRIPFTVRLRKTSRDGESTIIVNEETTAGRRVEGTMTVQAGDKVVARIVKHKEFGKAVAKITAA